MTYRVGCTKGRRDGVVNSIKAAASIALSIWALAAAGCTKLEKSTGDEDAGAPGESELDASEDPSLVPEADGSTPGEASTLETWTLDEGGMMVASAPGEGGMTAAPTDGSVPDGGAMASPEPCSTSGALRCAAGAAREICMSGTWRASDPCPRDTVCTMDDPAKCPSLLAACVGNMGKSVCTGSIMQHCNERALSAGSETCLSERLCQGGLEKGRCQKCVPKQYKCTGARLERCSDDGETWLPAETCATAALCNETSGACTAAACTAGQKRCTGDLLERCNPSATGFERDTSCMASLCDPVGMECDMCLPRSRSCAGASSYQVCLDSGQGYTPAACASGTPYCTGAGACVACINDTNCRDPGECKTAACTAGACVSSNDRLGSSCRLTSGGNGLCDSAGNCVQCLNQGDVCTLPGGGNGVCNGSRTCVQCNSVNDCTNTINGCQERTCNTTSGTCGVRARTGESCTTGRCNGSAQCVECLENLHCPSARPFCVNSVCRQCGTDADCNSAQLRCRNNMCINRCGDGTVERSRGEDCEVGIDGYTSSTCLLCMQMIYRPTAEAGCTIDPNSILGPANCPALPGFTPTCMAVYGGGCNVGCNTDANCPKGYTCSSFSGTPYAQWNPPTAGYCR